MSTMRVILSARHFNQREQNVLHFFNPDNATNHDGIFAEMRDHWLPALRNAQNNGLTWTDVSIQKVDGTPDLATVHVFSNQIGSLVGAGAPTVLAIVFSLRTATAGRTGHGRFYMPGVHQDGVSNSAVEANYLSMLNTAAATIMTKFGPSHSRPIQLVIAPRNSPTDFKPVTAIVVKSTFGVQRRRNIGVGN